MQRIKSSQERNKENSSLFLSNKNISHLSKSARANKIDRNVEIHLVENFSSNENQENINVEEILVNFYKYSLDSYKKKLYENLLKELEMNNNLLYKGNKESFNIVIIKIKCLMKLMVEKYENELNEINDEQMSLKDYINKIQKVFLEINTIIKDDDYYEYETITQVYCKFLIYLIKFAQAKEEYYKSLAYITLGINMIKIFFIRKKVTKDLKLYKRYIYLLLLLINHLIGEGNFTQALAYSETILKVIETGIKVLFNVDNNYDEKRKIKYLLEFIRCSGFIYIYIGLCNEFIKNQETSMEAYKQAFYFFMKLKSIDLQGFKLNEEKMFYDNDFIQLSHWFLKRIKNRIIIDKKRKEKIRKSIIEGLIEKKQENIEKKKKLKLVSSGLNENQKRYNNIENKLYENVLTSKNNKVIEKLDRALMTLAYQEKKKSSKINKKKKLSNDTMENMCHFQLYNKLMTGKYKEFIMTNNNIKLSNPKDEEDFIHRVNSYLTQTMEIKPQSANKNKVTKNKTEKNNKNLEQEKNSFYSANFFNNKEVLSNTPSINNKSENVLLNKNNKFAFLSDKNITKEIRNSKKLLFQKKFSFSSLKIDIPSFSSNLFGRKMTKSLSDNFITTKTINLKDIHINRRKKSKKNSNMVWTKSIYLNPKYFRTYMKLDKLIKKELDFQKDILNIKGNNCKLYHNSFAKEIFVNNKDKEEETNQDYMILTEKIDQKILNSQKEYEELIYFNIKKKKGNNKSLKINASDDGMFGLNEKFNFEGSGNEEEVKNFNEINKKSIMTVNERLKNIIYKIRERKRLLRKMKNN